MASTSSFIQSETLRKMKFKKKASAVPISTPKPDSRPPTSNRYSDMSISPLSCRPSYQKPGSNPRQTQCIWDNEHSLTNSRQASSSSRSTQPNPLRPIKRNGKCPNLPLSQSLQKRAKPSSTSFPHYTHPPHASRPPHSSRPPPKPTIQAKPESSIRSSTTTISIPSSPDLTHTHKRKNRQKKNSHLSHNPSPPPKKKSSHIKNHNNLKDGASTVSCTSSDVQPFTKSPYSDSVTTSAIAGTSSSTSVDLLKEMQEMLSTHGISLQADQRNTKITRDNDKNQDREDSVSTSVDILKDVRETLSMHGISLQTDQLKSQSNQLQSQNNQDDQNQDREDSVSTSVDLLKDVRETLLTHGISLQTGQLNSKISQDDNNQDRENLVSPEDDSIPTAADASSSASFDIFKDMQDQLSMHGIPLQTDRPNYRINYEDANKDWENLAQHEDESFEATQVIDNPESLCPFCDEPLPNKLSSQLVQLLEYLKNKPGVTRRLHSMNPLGLYLPFSDTAGCCQLHRAERKLIPEGIRKGWPTIIDFQALPRRIRSFMGHLNRVCTREVDSEFMQMALKEWTAQGGRKAQSVANELATFQVEQPGYYGVLGYEVIYRTLQEIFLKPNRIDSITQLARPLSLDFLLRKVLVPETALCLISEDTNLTINHPQVRQTLEDSRSYGVLMFPDQDDQIIMSGDKSETEEEAEDQEDQEDHRQKDQSSSNKLPKRKKIRRSTSSQIEVVSGNRLSPLRNSTNTSGKNFSPAKKKRKQRQQQQPTPKTLKQSVLKDLDSASTSATLDSKKPVNRSKGGPNRPRRPALKDGWQSNI